MFLGEHAPGPLKDTGGFTTQSSSLKFLTRLRPFDLPKAYDFSEEIIYDIVNEATLIKVKDRCAKFTSRLPRLISPKHLKTWSKLPQKFGQSSGHPPPPPLISITSRRP